jgi:hypothetical protein
VLKSRITNIRHKRPIGRALLDMTEDLLNDILKGMTDEARL